MTHLEKLEKIRLVQKETDASISLTYAYGNWQVRKWFHLGTTETEIISQESSPEKAIQAAYKKQFPLIEKSYGCWKWDKETKSWLSPNDALANWGRTPAGEYCYMFTQAGRNNATWVRISEMSDFELLRKVNPELLPPTEEE